MASEWNSARRRSELSLEQRAWLERRIREGAPGAPGDARIPRRPDPGAPVPLSPAQQRLWFIEKLRPGTSVHTVAMAFQLQGRLDVAALERSLAEIVRRHEALRTTIAEVGGEPVQVVQPATSFDLPIDHLKNKLRETFASDLDGYVRLHLMGEVRRRFDLTDGPLFRARLLRLGPRDHVLILTAHHLVIDGWSIGVIIRELGALYGAFAGGAPAPLEETPIEYADYALWQHERLCRGELDPGIAYWTRHLAGLEPTRLPRMSFRRGEGAAGGGRREVTIPPPLAERLRSLARQEGVTLYMALLAAFQALLARYTDRDDIAVASPIAGRTRLETEGLIGFFVNTLVLRTDLSGDPTFRELLGRVRAVALDAFAHQEAPFARVVAAIQPDRRDGQPPLSSLAFALHNTPQAPLELPGISVSRLEVEPAEAPFDLSLGIRAADGELRGWLDYDAGAFDADAIERLAGHFRTLLNGAVGDPDRVLSALPVLTPPERHQLLVEWNAPLLPIEGDRTIHGLFEAQVGRAPEAVAVAGEDEALTYGELNRRANRLAHRLRRLGIGRDTVVGLCLEPSPALVVAMVGVLKAGSAYLPLDPADPPARLAALLREARAPVVIARPEQVLGPVPAGCHRIEVAGNSLFPDEPDGTPDDAAVADDLAYVAYTSGSSGRPKGVMVPHRAVVRLVIDTDYARLTPDDVVAQVANPAFDAATFEIWGALLNGARLMILPRQVVLSPPDMTAALSHCGVSMLFLTTALFNLFARDAPSALRGIRQVLFGGETVDPSAVAAVLREGPPERLVHVYGPTETTTFATWHLVERVEPGATTIPIGRPVANTTVYVLDRNRRPVPIGVPGELYIGGPGVARGYLRQPRLTAERFLPDPFAADPAARRYRTGDRVRWRADGALEFLGRFDDQVKLRGFRVEPGEVEAVVTRHPAVAEAVVVLRDDAPGGKGLVAYIVPVRGSKPTASELRAFSKATLPGYMVPTAFVPLATLPMTPNGKVDRRALPTPTDQPMVVDAYAPPRSVMQEALADIWVDLLGLDRIGIHDDFFELGGHSLLAAQVISRLHTDLGIQVPVQTIFAAPTIADLAERIERERQDAPAVDGASASTSLMVLRTGRSGSPVFFVPGGVGEVANLFKIAQLARQAQGQEPFYGFLREGFEAFDERNPQVRVETVAAHFVAELRACQADGPYVLGGVCSGGTIALEMARQLRAQGQEVRLLLLFDAWRPGNQGDRASERLRSLLGEIRERRIQRNAALGAEAAVPAEADERSMTPETAEAPGTIGPRAAVVRPAFEDAPTIGGSAPAPGEDPLADGRAVYGYRPDSYPGRVVLFVNEEWHRLDPTLGWDSIVAGGLDVHVIPGSHRTYLLHHLGLVAAQLRTHLDQLRPTALGG